MDAGSLQRAPKSPPDASWTDPFSGVPSVDPVTRRSPSHRTDSSKATRSGEPFRLRVSRPDEAEPEGRHSAKPFHPRASRPVGPFRLPAFRPVGPSTRRQGPPEPFHRKVSRPADPSVSTLPGPIRRGPKATDPPNLSARRLPGRPNPSARELLDPMENDPKTKLHKRMFRQNKTPINKKRK